MMDRPLRFCMITTFYPPYNFGGDGIFVHQLSNALAKLGHQVDVIHCIDAYRLLVRQEPTNSYNDHPNVTVHGLKSQFGFLSPLATQQTGFPFFKSAQIRQVLEKGFDVIHYHNISLVGGPKILEYGQGIKLYTMHEYWLICPTHVLFRFNRAPCIKPHCFTCTLTYKRPPQLWRYLGMLKTSVKHVDAFIAPSSFVKSIHLQRGLNIPIVYLPNFVDLGDLTSPKSDQTVETPPMEPYYLFVGRLEKLKGLQTLIPIFNNYHKARLLIAGTGSYEPTLRHLAEGNNNVRFLGHLSHQQLKAYYQKAIAVIVPSICFEVFGQVIIEAFSQQTPTIVSNIGGMTGIIKDSGGGVVYDNDEQLLAAMDSLLADPSYRRELGLRGYNTYQQSWTPEAHLERYFALICEIAANCGKTKELA